MQKRVLYIAFLLLAICNQIVAEDQMTIGDFSLNPGGSKYVSVMLTNEDTYVGFQFDLYLPDGITVESVAINGNRIPDGTTPQMALQSNGSYRCIAAALNGNPIIGNEGAVLSIMFKAGETLSAQDYQGYLRNIKISKADGSGVTKAEQPFTITVQNAEAAPTFRFEGDYLFIETTTENTSIFYQMADLPDMSDETVEKVSSSLTVTADAEQSLYYEQPIELTKSVVLKAIAAGATNSEVSTLVYDYESWHKLVETIDYGWNLLELAKNHANVEGNLKEQLEWAIDESKHLYEERATMNPYVAQHFTDIILDLCAQIEQQMNGSTNAEPYAVLSDNNTVLTFYYDNQKSVRGGMDIGPFSYPGYQAWYAQRESVTKAIFDPSFANDTTLISTSYWFYGCNNLTLIEGIQYLHTENVTNMGYMFTGCSNLNSLDVSNFNTQNVKSFSFTFYNCSMLTNLDVKSFNTQNVVNMTQMFAGCSRLTSLELGNFNTSNVTSMAAMFSKCSELTNLDVSSFNTQKVTSMSSMFLGCSGLTKLDVSEFNTNNVSEMIDMFAGCSGLVSLDLSSFNTERVTSMSEMFFNCSNLTTIYVGSGWTTTSLIDGTFAMFLGCTNLVGGMGTVYDANHISATYAHIDGGPSNPGYFTDKNASDLKDGDTFTAVNSDGVELRYMVISAADKTCQVGDKPSSNIISSNDVATAVDTSYVGTIRIPEEAKGYRVVRVGFEAFYNCSHVTLIEMPNSITGIASAAFKYSGITSITIPSSVTIFENSSLSHCPKLESIVVDSQNSVYDSRNGCNAIIRTSSNTLVRGCATTVLTEKDGITTIGPGAFLECKGQEWSMVLPNTITSIETQAFNSCDLTAITLPSSLKSVGWATFLGSKITSLVVPASVTTIDEGSLHTSTMTSLVVDPGNSTFDSRDNCNAVIETATNKLVCGISTSVIPEGVTTIGTYAFDEIGNLKSVTLPASITKIEDRAFWGAGLKSITSLIEKTFNISEMTFDTNIYNTCELRVPVGASDVYRSTPYWSHFTNIVEMAPVVVDTVTTPTFRFDGFDYMAIESETQDAEIYYTMTRRMLAAEETDFSNGFLSRYGGWKTWGDNMSYGDVGNGGYNDSRCLKLVSKENGTFESAQAGYTFSNALTKDNYYMLYFKARSESGRGQLQVYCQNDTVAGTRSAADTLTIGSELADYEVMVKIDNTNTNQFVLNFGATADTYYIDNVQFGPVISDTTNQLRTRYEQPIELREGVNIKAVAMKEGMQESAPAYYDYFYDGWRMLLEMWEWGMKTFSDAYGDPNVPLQFVEESRMKSEDLFQYMLDRRDNEHVDDTELLEIIDYITRMAYEVEEMRRGFTIDGVSYHAVDSTQVEVIASLDYYSPYRNAVTIAKEVHYNNIDFQVTSVAQGAFANSKLGAIVWNPTVALKYEDVAVINNPNLLVYVNEASLAPENIQNVIVGDFAKNIVLTDVSEGNGSFYCPKEFKAEMISYTRNFQQQTEIGVSRGWESIALPFTVQTIMQEKNGLIAPFGNSTSNKHFWLRTLSENGLMSATVIEANTPYLISMPNSSEYPAEFNQAGRVTFSSQDALVPVTETRAVETSTADGEMIVLVPNFQSVSKDARTYALNVGEQRDGYPEGSVFEANYRDIRPFEAYTIHEGGQDPAPRFIPIVDMSNGATNIEKVANSQQPIANGMYYDLSGRKLQQKPSQKGVYLHRGRKVVIR